MTSKQQYVLVATPSIEAREGGGGITTGVAFLCQAWRDQNLQPPLRRMQTRGEGSVYFSAFYMLAFCTRLLWDSLFGRILLVHVNVSSYGSTVRKFVIVALSRICGRPVVLHLHGSVYDQFFRGLGPIGRRLVRWMFRSCQLVIVLGKNWQSFVVEEIGADPARVTILHNAVPDPEPVLEHADPSSLARIAFTGQVGDRKGVPELLDALSRPELRSLDWHLTIAGDGDVDRFRHRAAELGLDQRVEFVGWVGRDRVREILRESLIFVLASHAEGLSNALLEAMAFGRAIVTTPVGGHAEVIDHGRNGLLVPAGDSEQLAQALICLLSRPQYAVELGRQARATFEDGLDSQRYARNLQTLYARVLSVQTGA